MINKTIFLSTGGTFAFKDVTGVIENERGLTFHYTAVSDGLGKVVTFYRPEIAGHSTYVVFERGKVIHGTSNEEEAEAG